MDLVTLAAFTLAYTIAVLVPGPGVAAVVARALGGGFASAVPMVLGILVGDLIYLVFALFGLAAIATWFGPIIEIVRYAGAAYLMFIAWQFWTAKPGTEQIRGKRDSSWKTFLSGFALTLGNPKTIVFYLALLPTVVPLDQPITVLGFAELVVIVVVVLLIIGLAYAALAAAARDLFTSSKAIRRLNRTAGAMMATAAVFVAIRE
ncbi:MAG: LysE family translocator [Devosia sp.]|jgi:threonine/homoserine/homoserine lactone efflux protein|uniref:LysE family translocator n=1 Tax=Devosia sp. TaxID=1871048 RepID=UPI0037C17D53